MFSIQQGARMKFQLKEATAVLERTPAVLRAWLADLPAAWVRSDEGPDTWSPFDIVGHLIHGEETDWIPRLEIILTHGESRPFEPFDRFAQLEKNKDKTLDELLDAFAELRARNLETLKKLDLQSRQLDLTGTHPELGRVSARQLIATWVVHDLGHLAQISRVMARAYSDEVGPWKAFTPILHRRT